MSPDEIAQADPDDRTLCRITEEMYDCVLEDTGLDKRVHRRFRYLPEAQQSEIVEELRQMLRTPTLRYWMFQASVEWMAKVEEIRSSPQIMVVTPEQAERPKQTTRSLT